MTSISLLYLLDVTEFNEKFKVNINNSTKSIQIKLTYLIIDIDVIRQSIVYTIYLISIYLVAHVAWASMS